MAYFTNAVCPVCEQPLRENDDVVVCPECGAPYHRACYKQVGSCLYADKHGTGFTYLPEPSAKSENEEQGFVLCPRCGKGNPTDANACDNCGTPLQDAGTADAAEAEEPVPAYRRSRADVDPVSGKYTQPEEGFHFGTGGSGQQVEYDEENPIGQMMANLDEKQELDGFTLGEWLSFMGPNAPMYLFVFKHMHDRMTNLVFSLSAMLLGPIFLAYRKMWAWATVALGVRLVCAVPDMILALHSAKVLPVLPLAEDSLLQLGLAGTYLALALNVFWGLASYALYRKHCIRGMERVREAAGGAKGRELYQQMALQGSVSPVGSAIFALLLAATTMPFVWLMM